MFSYVPSRLARRPGLVVVLHGCNQTAASYDKGAGWSTLAERCGFALLAPEQPRSNNPNGCFNWFNADDTRRDAGETASIREMIEKLVIDNGIDRDRVFITGLSAGGAMTSVMLACYPEVFAGGAIIAGLPYGAAANVRQALRSMFRSRSRSSQEWGDLVRQAVPHNGPWPRISVWHGSADKTVVPKNAREIIKQWTNVHGLPPSPATQSTVDGYPRQAWFNGAGDELIESYTITHMAHGAPLATGPADHECGTAGPFWLDVGISSSYRIAEFFGLVSRSSPVRSKVRPADVYLCA
jgi:feruloyl esterase